MHEVPHGYGTILRTPNPSRLKRQAPEVTDVLVSLDVEISDYIIFFGGCVYDVVLVLGEVDQVDTVLFRVECSLLSPTLAIVNDYL